MSKSWPQTAVAVTSSMVGTSLLVIPIIYTKIGIIPNIIGATLMCAVMTTLAVFIASLVSGRNRMFSDIVHTYLGKKWGKSMNTIIAFEVLMVCCIIFLLSSDIIFQLLKALSPTVNRMGAQVFKSFLVVAYVPFTLLNSLNIIVKFGWLTMLLLWTYVATMFYSFIENIPVIDYHAFDTKPNFGFADMDLCISLQAFAFLGHTTLDAVIKQNRDPKTNKKAVAFGFILAYIIMLTCGLTGGLALYKKQVQEDGDNILHYFAGYWQFYVLGTTIFVYLLSFFPILAFVSRYQAFEVLPAKFKQTEDMKEKRWTLVKVGFNIVLFILLQIFVVLDVSPARVMGFLSTTVCFYFCYFLPLTIKLKLTKRADNLQSQGLLIDNSSLLTLPTEPVGADLRQDPELIPKSGKATRNFKRMIYYGFFIFGVAMFISQFVLLFTELIQ